MLKKKLALKSKVLAFVFQSLLMMQSLEKLQTLTDLKNNRNVLEVLKIPY